MEFSLYIDDVNDEYPAFENEPYRLEIKEVSCNTRMHANFNLCMT